MASPEHCKMTGWAKLWTVPVCKMLMHHQPQQLYPDTSDRKRKCWMWLGTVYIHQPVTSLFHVHVSCGMMHFATYVFLGMRAPHRSSNVVKSFICCNNSAFWKYAVHFALAFIAIPSIQEPIQTGQGDTFQHIWWVFLHHWSSEKQR